MTAEPQWMALANRLLEVRAPRRAALKAAVAIALGAFAAAPLTAQTPPAPRVRFSADPFALGVGSGYPRADRVSLWTRLAPAPLEADGGMQAENVDVSYEVASDERFATIVASGRRRAVPELGHSVHADAGGLSPGRWYWYRFRSGEAVSPIGRTRTADAPNAEVARLKLAVASCQHYEQGFFNAYRHLAEENLDLMLFVGDYIYENSWGDDLVRRHVGGLLHTLTDYRARHAQYRLDPDLQHLHATVPWLLTWDDHEVDNDYAGDQSEHLDPAFLARRAAAYQAYFEHMPLPPQMRPTPSGMRIYGHTDFGRLARIYMLDDRQYRSPQVCPDPYKGGGSIDVSAASCPELTDPTRTLLGSAQEQWLDQAIAGSKARWNLIGQQTLLAHYATPRADGTETVWTDGWDGYPHARERVLAAFERHDLANPVILGGDLHATVVANVRRSAAPDAPVIAAEFCGTSISAQGSALAVNEARVRHNPHIKFADMTRRGYLSCELTPAQLRVSVRTVDTVKAPTSRVETQREFVVSPGRPGVSDA